MPKAKSPTRVRELCNRNLSFALSDSPYAIELMTTSELVLAGSPQKAKPPGYVWVIPVICLLVTGYFTLIEWQPIIVGLAVALGALITFALVGGAKRMENLYLKYDYDSGTIEYRNGYSKDTTSFYLDPAGTILCELHEYDSHEHGPSEYAADVWYTAPDGKKHHFIECHGSARVCKKFAQAFARLFTEVGGIADVHIADHTD